MSTLFNISFNFNDLEKYALVFISKFFRFGSDALKREFLAPSIQGDVVACLGVSEPGAGAYMRNGELV